MAPVPPWGLAIAVPGGLLLLLLLCAFFPRASGRWSSRAAGREEPSPGVLSVVKLSEPGPSEGGAAVPAGTSSCSRTDGTGSGDPGVLGPPPLHAPPGPTPRTPDFLRHRQLPLVPGDAQTPAAEARQDAEGPIYESIRYKSRKLSAGLRKPCGATGDIGDGGDPGQGLVVQEEPCGDGSPCPVYARVRKAPRAPQHSAPSHGPEPEEEAPPALPEKHFDDL
ncbi:collagen alpha-1(I) chain-like [Cygnus olor]|uniref:collagen alpha-1(I) chain-like n=1 Tax=Cygnus olor TaxID=8869 RepID=UPI001ADE285C|nr:collagen alpha-1(I) chain-like [Cygnus olor]